MLSTAIRKSNGVGSANCLAIRGFSSVESSLGIIISHGILVGVWLGGILRLLVWGGCWVVGWLVDNRLGVVDRLVNYGGGVVGWFVNYRCRVVSRFVNNWGGNVRSGGRVVWFGGGFVCGYGGVIDRCWAWVVWGGAWVVGCGGGVVGSRSWVVGSGGIAMGQGSGSMDFSYWFFVTAVPMDRLRSSMGLASDRGMNSAVGLVNRDADRGGVPLLEHLVVRLVSNS